MTRTLAVHLGTEATLISMLRHDTGGGRENSVFQYDPSWLTADSSFVIEHGLPLLSGPQFHRKTRNGPTLHLAVADTEPDG